MKKENDSENLADETSDSQRVTSLEIKIVQEYHTRQEGLKEDSP